MLTSQDLLILVAFFLMVIAVGYAIAGQLQPLIEIKKKPPEKPPQDPPQSWRERLNRLWAWFNKEVLDVLRPPPPKAGGDKPDVELAFRFKLRYPKDKVPEIPIRVTNNTKDKLVYILWDQSTITITYSPDKVRRMIYLADPKLANATKLKADPAPMANASFISTVLTELPDLQVPQIVPPGVLEDYKVTAARTLETDKESGALKPTTIVKIGPPPARAKLEAFESYRRYLRGQETREFSLSLVYQVGDEPTIRHNAQFTVRNLPWYIRILVPDGRKKA